MLNIWWAYDESSGSFSALPASPLLLPCIGLFFLFAVLDKSQNGSKAGRILESADRAKADMTAFEINRTRYKRLLAILAERPLTEQEDSELYQLEHPKWGKPGEDWTY
jgi:hypothetical protein